MNDTLEDREWWLDSQAVTALAEWLARRGADGITICRLYESPWDFCLEHDTMLAEFSDGLEGLLHG